MSNCEKTQAIEQALYWIETEAANPGQATPDAILKTLRKSIDLNPDDTVNEASRRESSAPLSAFSIAAPKDIYLWAHSIDDDSMEDPEFALMVLDQAILDRLNELKTLFEEAPYLTELRTLGGPIWRPNKAGDELYDERISLDELVVVQDGFWYRTAGKDGGAIETSMVSWGDLERYVQQDGGVVYQASGFDVDNTGERLKCAIDAVWEEESETTEEQPR